MEAKDPEGLVNLEPRVCGWHDIYIGDHQTLLYTCTKYAGLGT